MAHRLEPHRVVAVLEAALAVGSAAIAAFLITTSIRAAHWAERTYGHNVDAGALEWVAAILVFAPAAILLAVASWSLWRQWRIRWWVQGVLAACLAGLWWVLTRS